MWTILRLNDFFNVKKMYLSSTEHKALVFNNICHMFTIVRFLFLEFSGVLFAMKLKISEQSVQLAFRFWALDSPALYRFIVGSREAIWT